MKREAKCFQGRFIFEDNPDLGWDLREITIGFEHFVDWICQELPRMLTD